MLKMVIINRAKGTRIKMMTVDGEQKEYGWRVGVEKGGSKSDVILWRLTYAYAIGIKVK